MSRCIRSTWAVAKRELLGYFTSPVAYVFIVIFLVLTGFFTFQVSRFFDANQASLQGFFFWHPWLYLFLVPAVGMRLWSEEKRNKTLELIMTLPITPAEAIWGKFLASWAFLGLALLLTFPIVITVNALGEPDSGVIFSGYFGSFLVAGTYLGIGSFTSAMTRNQVISFITSAVVCIIMVLSGFEPVVSMFNSWLGPFWVELIEGFSVLTHYESMGRGVIDSRDLIYFVTLIGFSMFSTSVILRSRQGS